MTFPILIDLDDAVPIYAQIERQIRARPHYWYQFYPFWTSQQAVPREVRDAAASTAP